MHGSCALLPSESLLLVGQRRVSPGLEIKLHERALHLGHAFDLGLEGRPDRARFFQSLDHHHAAASTPRARGEPPVRSCWSAYAHISPRGGGGPDHVGRQDDVDLDEEPCSKVEGLCGVMSEQGARREWKQSRQARRPRLPVMANGGRASVRARCRWPRCARRASSRRMSGGAETREAR